MKMNSRQIDRHRPLVIVAAAFAMAGTASSQESSVFDPDYNPPRTSFGHPDLQAVWSNAILTPLERPPEFGDQAFLTEEQANAYRAQRLQVFDRAERQEDVARREASAINSGSATAPRRAHHAAH
jgi:hypothetical protein